MRTTTMHHFRWAGTRLGRCGLGWLVVAFSGWLLLDMVGSATAAEAQGTDPAEPQTYRLTQIPPGATAGLGSWIWKDTTADHQRCRLWKDVEIPAGAKVVQARLRIAVDDGYQLYLGGRELAQAANWRAITEYDLTLLLTPGRHVLAVNAFNDYLTGGMICSLRVELSDGRVLDYQSDESWRIVPEHVREWEKLESAHSSWPAATIVREKHPYWSLPSWPEDYVMVPAFQPLVIPFWQRGWFQVALASACGGVLLVCIALVFQLMLQSKEQRLLNQERARIARDIHDDFGTRLTRLILEGELARTELKDAKAGARLTRINDGMREALGAMDEVLWAVNPQRDTVRDFVTYLCEYAQAYLQPAGILCLLEIEPDMPPLEFELPLRRSLLLAVKEAVANVARHSGAQQLVLRVSLKDGSLVVVVEDNGKGFDPKQPGGRNGLGNMVHRMREVGGDCQIVSAPGAGCRVEFNIPLARRRPRFGSLLRGVAKRLRREAGSGRVGPADENA